MMAEEEKPFRCYQPDCGMRFTNEDHLSVHMKKHDMSLALNLGSGLGGLSPQGLCDQTPTPTKFLKNCEELGLFQELSKNPFEDSFKKALDGPGDEPDTSDTLGIPGPGGMMNLDTPLPSNIQVPRIVTEHVGDEEIKSPTKAGPNTLSSIVPKKREKYLSSCAYPTSTTSDDDEKLAAPTSTNTENDVKPVEEVLPDSVDELLGDGSEVPAVSSTKTEHTLADSVDDILADAVELITTSSTGIQPVMEVSAPSEVLNTAVANQNTAMANQSKPSVLPNHVTMQALLQLPNGQAIPIQLPGSIVAQPQTQMVSVQTVSPPKNTTAITKKTIPRIVQGNTQFVQTVPNIVQQRPVMQGVVQSVSGAVHNLPVGIVQNPVTRPVPLQTVKLGPSPLTQTVALQQTGNHSVFATVISPNNQTVTQTNTVIAPQFVVQSAQKKPAVSPKLQAQSTSKTSPNQGSQPYTKQRLKAALTGNITPSSTMKINHIFKIVEEVRNEQQQQSQDAVSVVSPSDTVSSPDETPIPVKQARFELPGPEAEDSEEKRRKFLERNRAAAARCRQKRKSWIYNLESKAEELTNVNNKLQKEITSLRGEVAHLKKLLIAHKDCPITIQQKSMGHLLTQQTMQQEESNQSSESMDMEPIDILPAMNGEIPGSSDVANVPVITVDPLGAPLVATTASVPMATGVLTGPNSVPMVTSVLTGPNTMGMIPTIVNLDFYTKQDPT